MSMLTKDYVEVGDDLSLDELIGALTEIRDKLPEGADPKVRMRGDDVFGRHLSIAYTRALTSDEAECAERYGAGRAPLRSVA